MRIVKLPHLPSDSAKAQPGDLIPDVWYKGKEYQVEQTQEEQYIKMKNIVIFGAPGSGKGTQSDKLIEHYGLEHISTGDVLRAEIKKGSELGKTAQGYIDQGQLIPDELMVSILASVYDSFGRAHKGVICLIIGAVLSRNRSWLPVVCSGVSTQIGRLAFILV